MVVAGHWDRAECRLIRPDENDLCDELHELDHYMQERSIETIIFYLQISKRG